MIAKAKNVHIFKMCIRSYSLYNMFIKPTKCERKKIFQTNLPVFIRANAESAKAYQENEMKEDTVF